MPLNFDPRFLTLEDQGIIFKSLGASGMWSDEHAAQGWREHHGFTGRLEPIVQAVKRAVERQEREERQAYFIVTYNLFNGEARREGVQAEAELRVYVLARDEEDASRLASLGMPHFVASQVSATQARVFDTRPKPVSKKGDGLCPRTLCLFQPGQVMPDVYHTFAYRGSVPMSGPEVCITCGRRKDDL